MNDQVPREWDEEERMRQFATLFPPEYFSTIAPAELAPSGWNRSPLRLTFHPTVEQVYDEAVRTHRNIASLWKDREPARPEPTLAEVQAEFRETPTDPPSEIRDLLGRCLWDVFSDNHDVLAPEDAFAKEKANQEQDAEIVRMRESMDEAHRTAVEEARNRPPPPTVQAYQVVFGGYPRGWPPTK